jgi:crotonobetainyl-CoA:carnitine CoA-transferase CaiB-like acyl-CoA transferase
MGLGESPRKAVESWCLAHTVDEIVTALVAADIPVAPGNTVSQVAEDPRLWGAQDAGQDGGPGRRRDVPRRATIKMSRTLGGVGPVPTPGQHTDEVLPRLLGYDQATLAELRQAKVIA